jgi:accessory colonization factor AcfC
MAYTKQPKRDWVVVLGLMVIAMAAFIAILIQGAGGPRTVLEAARDWFELDTLILQFH